MSLGRLLFYWGWGNLCKDWNKTIPNQSSNNTVQIKKSRNIFFLSLLVDTCPSRQSSRFPSLYPHPFSCIHVSSHFLSVKSCLAFLKKVLIFAFAVLCVKVADWMDVYTRCLKFSENPEWRDQVWRGLSSLSWAELWADWKCLIWIIIFTVFSKES